MELAQTHVLFTVAEYLARERSAEERSEFLDGRIYAMAGESPEHGDISANLLVAVGTQIRGTPCRARTKDTKVLSGPLLRAGKTTKGLFSYPDIVVICGEPEVLDEHKDVVLNPKAIFEVLSEHTELFDRGEKFERFQRYNPSLTDYVLVSQRRPKVEHYHRQTDGTWSYQILSGLDAILKVKSIGCKLPLAEIYERVSFPDDQEEVESKKKSGSKKPKKRNDAGNGSRA